MDEIRRRVLRGIAHNRTPGFHFAGNFLGLDLVDVGTATRVVMEAGPHNTTGEGRVHLATVFMAADIALAASIRSQLAPHTRLATVGMQLQLNGVPITGPIEARGEFRGFLAADVGRQGLARVVFFAGGSEVGFGQGAFMPLEAPPGMKMFPLQPTRRPDIELPDEATLDDTERDIVMRADRALCGAGGSFIGRFLGIAPVQTENGASCRMENGSHVGNRVGHAQGGILMGLAAATADAALGQDGQLSSIAASYVSPGEGGALEASASIVHRGRWTAVVRTEVIAPGGRRVLEVTTHHSRRE
jgi:acyl-coenzyme A thioesterase PaaI-like protein